MSIIRREKSRIGMYHVLAQGAGNHELFHDDEDYQVFVEYLARLMKEAWAEDDEPDRPYFHTYAYCLTPKQFRLIVKEEKYQVSAIMQSISQLYSRYYSGKVHQEPLRLGVIGPRNTRNTQKEMIVQKAQEEEGTQKAQIAQEEMVTQKTQKAQKEALDEWEWSSWHEYVGVESELPRVCEKPDNWQGLTAEEWREVLSKPLPEGMKCLEPKEYRAPKPTETQVLGMVRLMTTATTWERRYQGTRN